MLVEGLTDDGVEWVQHYEYVKFRPKLIEDKEIFEVIKFINDNKKNIFKILPHLRRLLVYIVQVVSQQNHFQKYHHIFPSESKQHQLI